VTLPVEDWDADTPKEACGVFGVYAPGQSVAHLTYAGLYALQHRGQESAGMAVSDGEHIFVVKDMGLVTHAFDERKLAPLQGHLAIGHVRYSTTGSSIWDNAQPVYRSIGDTEFALGHNGNLTNTAALAAEAETLPGTIGSDSDLVAELLLQAIRSSRVRSDDRELEFALLQVLPRLEGAFSFVLNDEAHLIGVRDPNGFRPLCLGKLDSGWVLASETPALDIVGAHFVRELDPGEMVVIDANGWRSLYPFAAEKVDPKLCLFEFVYFARPDSRLYGQGVHAARGRMGESLARQAPVVGDMVMGVPESGIPAAQGYAKESGIPYGDGLVKNRYIGRTFIAPSQEMRSMGVRMKLNPLRENLVGKRVVVVDDSVVRGTTQKQLVKMLREAGVKEVHLRLTSPPIKWSCFYGIDTGARGELLAANLQVDEIRDYLDVDSIAFITLDRLVASTGAPGAGFCDACFTGVYPTEIPVNLTKAMLEGGSADPPGELEALTAPTLFSDGLLPADDARRGR
jgi:amidophosphoribosyltransferase